MLISTTPTIEGKTIRDYKGVVAGETILGANVFRNLFAGSRDIVGGRSVSYEDSLRQARQIAIEEMAEEARKIGADAVIGVDADYMMTAAGATVTFG